MIAGSNGDRSGDTRPLWITGLSPPDSWRSLRQPGYLQLDQVRHPKHRVWGYDRTLKVRNISIDKSRKFSVAIDTQGWHWLGSLTAVGGVSLTYGPGWIWGRYVGSNKDAYR